MKRETKILIVLFVFALLIRILFSFSSPVKWWDETVYSNLGYGLSKNPLDYSFANCGWSDFIGDNMWPKAGFRAPLLPYTLAIFYFLKLEFLIDFLMPLIGALSVIFTYLLGKRLFNSKIGIYSALFLSFLPLHIYFSGKILTDVFSTFFILLSILCFWKGYEQNEKPYKLVFGFLLALTVLSRYTALWIIPSFFIYLVIKNKSLKFLKDKSLWQAFVIFLLTLLPWFVYSFFTYGNPLGAFIHGSKAASYWGGSQPWYFFFQHSPEIFSVVGILFIFSLIYIIIKKEFKRKEIYFLLFWIFLFLFMAILMPHKEERFLLPILPAVCILGSFFLDRLKIKFNYKITFIIIILFLLSLFIFFYFERIYKDSYTDENDCFLKGNAFLRNTSLDSVIITGDSPITYYYTKRETRFYPNVWSIDSIKNLVSSYKNREVYIFFSNTKTDLMEREKQDLDSNFQKVFDCRNSTLIYYFNNL